MTTPQINEILKNAVFLGKHENNSPEWHELRNEIGVISGSEIGAILGLSPFTSAMTLWAQKTGKLENQIAASIPMRLGQLVEPAIRTLYEEQHPDHLVYEVGTYASNKFDWIHANPDGIGISPEGEAYILEIKHTATYWDAVPEHYRAQVFWYMFVFNLKKTVFAVVNAGRYKEYEVLWDEFEWQAIFHKVNEFRSNVLEDTIPDWDGSESTYETVRKLSPDVENRDEELGQLGIELHSAQDKFDESEAYLREVKSRTIAALNGAKNGTIDGIVCCTLSQRAGGVPYLTIKGKK